MFPNPGFREDQAHPVNLPDYIDAKTGEMVKISVYPRPRQQPTPPLWQVVDGERSIEFAAKNDLGIIMWRPPVHALKERFRLYQDTHEKATGRSIPFGRRCGIVRDTFVARTMKEARERAGKAVMRTLNWSNWRGPSIYLNPGETLDPRAQAALKKELTFDFVNERSLLVGTPDYVAEKIAELRDELDLEQMVIACHWPGLPHADTMASVRLFAEEVMPRFASETEPTEAAA
jgi:alkanesulfonate monooxygenase SsuD/methylene tetrahydromethanopterin reductase-like flavin-dependent oxidoreductase (luciferase family)